MHSCTYTISTCIQFSVIVLLLIGQTIPPNQLMLHLRMVPIQQVWWFQSLMILYTIEPQELFYGTLEAVQGINVLIDQAEIRIIDNDGEMKRQSLHTCCHNTLYIYRSGSISSSRKVYCVRSCW